MKFNKKRLNLRLYLQETILLDVHRRSVNLEFRNSCLIPGEGAIKLTSLKGIRVVKESGETKN